MRDGSFEGPGLKEERSGVRYFALGGPIMHKPRKRDYMHPPEGEGSGGGGSGSQPDSGDSLRSATPDTATVVPEKEVEPWQEKKPDYSKLTPEDIEKRAAQDTRYIGLIRDKAEEITGKVEEVEKEHKQDKKSVEEYKEFMEEWKEEVEQVNKKTEEALKEAQEMIKDLRIDKGKESEEQSSS